MVALYRNNYEYNNQYFQWPSTPKIWYRNQFKMYLRKAWMNLCLTFCSIVFRMTYLLFVWKPVNASSNSTFWWISNWSIDAKYSNPGGQSEIPVEIVIQPPVHIIYKRYITAYFITSIVQPTIIHNIWNKMHVNQILKLWNFLWAKCVQIH